VLADPASPLPTGGHAAYHPPTMFGWVLVSGLVVLAIIGIVSFSRSWRMERYYSILGRPTRARLRWGRGPRLRRRHHHRHHRRPHESRGRW